MAFQIQDDILDVTSTTEVLGKPVGSDEKNHKTTYVSLKGMGQAKQDMEYYFRHSVKVMDMLVVKNEFLTQLMLNLIQREK